MKVVNEPTETNNLSFDKEYELVSDLQARLVDTACVLTFIRTRIQVNIHYWRA